jgi:hypothetical protein
MYLQSERNTKSLLRASLLQESVEGFRIGRKALLNVNYAEIGKTAYHRYEGGSVWMATAPSDFGEPGQTMTISPKLLAMSEFVSNLTPIEMVNEAGFSWLPAESRILRLSEAPYRIEVEQKPAVEGVSRFDVPFGYAGNLGFVPGCGCFLEVKVSDFFGRARRIRFYHDGHSPAHVGLRQGRKYPRVSFFSFDGVRLRVAYGSPMIRVASFYLNDPSPLYRIELSQTRMAPMVQNLGWKPARCYRIGLKRSTEQEMVRSRDRYPHGRLGSEISYSIANHDLGFRSLTLNDPAEGGPDMITSDGRVLFENRLVTITEAMSKDLAERQLRFQLTRLKTRLVSDLAFYRKAELGCAFLSYVDLDGIRTMMFEMRR